MEMAQLTKPPDIAGELFLWLIEPAIVKRAQNFGGRYLQTTA